MSSIMGNTKYCLCCGEEVPYNTFDRGETRELTCTLCGFTLEIEKVGSSKRRPDGGVALVADDSKYTRKIIEDLILEKKFSSSVLCFENGLELISSYTSLLEEGTPVNVAILDLNMPVMDGLTAARTMRALEERLAAERVPIVFFSGVRADENLKRQMHILEPANYVNKGSDPDPDRLASRMEDLLDYLMEKRRLFSDQ
jgi:CheY-like chemotaxis protein